MPLLLHKAYTECPGGDWVLVPAVEILEEGQLEPDDVVVADGPVEEMTALTARLQDAGFNPTIATPEGWPMTLVTLPWGELTDRTVEAEAIFQRV